MTEILTQAGFDARIEAGELALTLVGMSNVGKSFWSSRLAKEAGFSKVDCDDEIEAELGETLRDEGYSGGITDVAKWMGQPYEDRFTAHQQTYLDLETMTMRRVIERITPPLQGGNTVIDTTGSIVHVGDNVCREVADRSVVVHLEASPDLLEEMFELYIAEPKPVIWGDIYVQADDQSPAEALAVCYPKLLGRRNDLYSRMAHITIPRETSLALSSSKEFLGNVKDSLPA